MLKRLYSCTKINISQFTKLEDLKDVLRRCPICNKRVNLIKDVIDKITCSTGSCFNIRFIPHPRVGYGNYFDLIYLEIKEPTELLKVLNKLIVKKYLKDLEYNVFFKYNKFIKYKSAINS